MNWQDIKSSAICSIAYELDQGLFVLFQDGTEYLYKNAPIGVFKAWLKAESKGRFFNMNIRGKFEGFEV